MKSIFGDSWVLKMKRLIDSIRELGSLVRALDICLMFQSNRFTQVDDNAYKTEF